MEAISKLIWNQAFKLHVWQLLYVRADLITKIPHKHQHTTRAKE